VLMLWIPLAQVVVQSEQVKYLHLKNKDLAVMHKELLSKLKWLVNSHQQWEHLSNYLDALIEEQHRVMEQSGDVAVLHRSQGAVHILRKIKKLRDEINANG
jgi:hypothetical protein